MFVPSLTSLGIAIAVLSFAAPAPAATDDVLCEAARLKLAAGYASCTLKAEATALLKATAVDYSKCVAKFDAKCAKVESKYGAACPLPADCTSIKTTAQCGSDALPLPTTTTTTTLPGCGAGPDADEDGVTELDGDCDDCDPLVNPGALELANGIDDDCNGMVDDLPAACDSGLGLADTDAMNGARAIELCQQTTLAGSKWGVLSVKYARADGSAVVPSTQVGLMDTFGTNVPPLSGQRLLALSSGAARTTSQPGFCASQSCATSGAGTAPAGFPQSIGCPLSASIYDDIALEVVLRVPTNAVGYRFRLNFYTFDYPEWICSAFNDQYVTLVSPAPPGIANGNISFDAMGNAVSVNSSLPVCSGCSGGTSELDGTGFDLSSAGATDWLVTRAPATGGSVITIRFAMWDTGDDTLDSTVLLDGFEWITGDPVFVQTTPVP